VRVGVDVYQAGFAYGGISRYVRGLVPALVEAGPEDHFTLVSNSVRPRELVWRHDRPNVCARTLRVPRRLMQACWDHLAWPPIETLVGPVDVYHGTHFVLPATRAARRVLTVHDVMFLRHPEYFSNRSLNERWHSRELRAALQRADLVITVSACTREDLADLLRFDRARIRVVHSGVEDEFLVPDGDPRGAEMRRRYRLDGPYLVFLVGTPEPRKNLARTVEAARRGAPDVPLVIIGPVEAITHLLQGDSQGIRCLGPVPDTDLPLVLHEAEVALYPSLYEGFGFPALEALAAGVPLITSDCSALPEVVGDAAVLVNPESVEDMAQAIRSLLKDTERRRKLIVQGRARAKELSWDQAARQVLAVYRELL
jgi:glycosyltransferase involved in cell wall biosynthesis